MDYCIVQYRSSLSKRNCHEPGFREFSVSHGTKIRCVWHDRSIFIDFFLLFFQSCQNCNLSHDSQMPQDLVCLFAASVKNVRIALSCRVWGWWEWLPTQKSECKPQNPTFSQDSCIGPYVVDVAVCASATCFSVLGWEFLNGQPWGKKRTWKTTVAKSVPFKTQSPGSFIPLVFQKWSAIPLQAANVIMKPRLLVLSSTTFSQKSISNIREEQQGIVTVQVLLKEYQRCTTYLKILSGNIFFLWYTVPLPPSLGGTGNCRTWNWRLLPSISSWAVGSKGWLLSSPLLGPLLTSWLRALWRVASTVSVSFWGSKPLDHAIKTEAPKIWQAAADGKWYAMICCL